MADPLSIAASIAGLVSLADVVVTKGYKYIKAVKECEQEVRSLIVNVDVLCGILKRLELLSEKRQEDEDEDEDENEDEWDEVENMKKGMRTLIISHIPCSYHHGIP